MTEVRPENRDLSTLWDALSAPQQAVLQRAATSAEEDSGEAYLVGGPVRDLLRGDTRLHDIDIVITADARDVARRFAMTANAEVVKATDFGTATVHLFDDNGDMTRVDFVTARTETYPRPGALPVVAFPADINLDLHRRDVTINAMALPITPHGFGNLLDPTGGLTDLRNGIIRVLHDASFHDDPTRLYRAVRYVTRFGLTIEPHTAALLHAAVADGALTTISPDRKRHELEFGLHEPDPVACFAAFDAFGLLRATSPVLIWDDWVATRMRLVTPTVRPWSVLAFFVCRQGDAAVEQLRKDLPVGGLQRPMNRLVHVWRERDVIAHAPRLSAIRPLLEKLTERDVLALLFDEPAAPRATAFYQRLHYLMRQERHWGRSFGDYLTELGVTPGPTYGAILGALRDARFDGDVETLEETYAFIRTSLDAHHPLP